MESADLLLAGLRHELERCDAMLSEVRAITLAASDELARLKA